MIMEPLVYLLVTATTLTSHLAYLRQAMATLQLHVVYATISILLDMGGARLIRDLGEHHKYLVNGHPTCNTYIEVQESGVEVLLQDKSMHFLSVYIAMHPASLRNRKAERSCLSI